MHEAARLADLRALDILDSEPKRDFDLVLQAAAALFDVPIALVSLVDAERQWFKATHGLSFTETPRDVSLCAYAIEDPDRVMVVPDASRDERFAHNPLVTGAPEIRFYAGAPLVSARGFALGTVCVIDRHPRSFGPRECEALRALAAMVMRLIERDRMPRLSEPERTLGDGALTALPGPAPTAVVGWDRDGHIVSWNSAAEALLGWRASEVLGNVAPFLLDAQRGAFARDSAAVLAGGPDSVCRCFVRTKDDRRIQAAMTFTRGDDVAGAIPGFSTIEAIGARIEAERRLTMFESVVVNSSDALIVTSATPGAPHRIIYVNAAFTKMTGYGAHEVVGRTPAMLQGPETDPSELARISLALLQRTPVSAEVINYRKDGTPFSVEFNISPVAGADGQTLFFIAIQRETTARRAIERYERERSRVLEMSIRNDPLETQLARVVALLKDVIPQSLSSIMLLTGDQLFLAAADPDLPPAFLAAIDGVVVGPDVGSCGTAVARRETVICGDLEQDVEWRRYRDSARAAGLRACWSVPFFDPAGAVIGTFALYADRPAIPTARERELIEDTARFVALMVDRHHDRRRLERLALHDALTDLPNRKLIEQTLNAALGRARVMGRTVGVGVLDINRFKAINDAFGHHVGDALLCAIAGQLTGSLREGDVVGRMAGDEFVVIYSDLADSGDGIAAAHRLLEEFNTPFFVEGYEIAVRPSLGLAFYPETAADLAGLVQSADKAMYAAKLRGGGLELATAPVVGSAMRALDLEKDLRYALERGELELYFQMMFDLRDGQPVGAEALLRWNHPQLGLIGPGDFIPLMEANGTIVPVGTWVIGDAVRVARGWQDDGHDAFVTVNVSALQFDAPGLVADVVAALERHGLEPHRLHLELTESLVMRNPTASAAVLLALKALGVHIVIDDFGTGYSSLAYLQRFTFDALKIDRAFVMGIGEGPTSSRSEHIVAAVVALADALGVTTIAEGVEDAAQYAFVQSCGCTVVQGFLCARPVPADQLRWTRSIGRKPRHLAAG